MTQRPVSRLRHASSATRLSGLAAILSALVVTLAVASPVAAHTPRPPKFSGAAPGSVSCAITGKVSFSPALTHTGGGTNPSSVKAKLSSCTASNRAVTIKSAKVTGSFSKSPLSCVTLASTAASSTLTVAWKGNLAGSVGGTSYAGTAKFTSTKVSGGSSTGSFAGASRLTVNVPSDLATLCAATRGAKKATVTGTLTVGTTGGGGGGVPGAVSVVSDAVGYCALLTSGSVDCWGDNQYGELGNGTATGPDCSGTCNPTPGGVTGVGEIGKLTGVASLASSAVTGATYCALLTSTAVDCWGYGVDGELGNNTGASSNFPVVVTTTTGSGTLTGVASLISDGDGFCALLTSGSVDCWGYGPDGELGNNTGAQLELPGGRERDRRERNPDRCRQPGKRRE